LDPGDAPLLRTVLAIFKNKDRNTMLYQIIGSIKTVIKGDGSLLSTVLAIYLKNIINSGILNWTIDTINM